MAKKTKKSAKRKAAKTRRCPPCTAGAMARAEFSSAIRGGHCSVAARELDKIKSDLGQRADNMSKGARALAFRDVLQKQASVQHCHGRAAQRVRDSEESTQSNRFNGLLGLGFLGL